MFTFANLKKRIIFKIYEYVLYLKSLLFEYCGFQGQFSFQIYVLFQKNYISLCNCSVDCTVNIGLYLDICLHIL